MLIGPKNYVTRTVPYSLEISEETAAAMNWQYGTSQQPLLAEFTVACRALPNRKWTPYLRLIAVNNQPQIVPAEYGEDGAATADCSADIAEGAADALCMKFLGFR